MSSNEFFKRCLRVGMNSVGNVKKDKKRDTHTQTVCQSVSSVPPPHDHEVSVKLIE